jgi:DHA1 family inner membrane transport protein
VRSPARATEQVATSDSFILTALIVTMIVNQTGVVIISPLVVDIGASFGISDSLAGQLRTVAALSSALLAPYIGVLSERIGRKPILLTGLGIIGVTGLGSALAPTFLALVLVQFLAGIGVACLLSMGLAAVGDYFAPERRSWAMGMVNIGQPLAWIIGLPLIGFLADALSWRWSFVGVPVLFSLIGLAFVLRLPKPEGFDEAEESRNPHHALREILADRSATAWVLTELCAYTGWAGTLTFLGVFYIDRYDLTAGKASPLLALSALGFVGGSLVAHHVADCFGQRQTILVTAILSGMVLIGAMIFSWPLLPTVILLILFGLSQGSRGATSNTLGLQQSTRYRGAMMALRASVAQLGYVFGGLIGGLVLAWSGMPLLALVFGVLIALSGVLLRLFVDERAVV